jgi:hypothetical protein
MRGENRNFILELAEAAKGRQIVAYPDPVGVGMRADHIQSAPAGLAHPQDTREISN